MRRERRPPTRHERVLTHKFVEFIPNHLEDLVIYVSIPYATVAHKCCCGCGTEVVTPLSPTEWKLIFDGESVSLDPSIGNWSFPCQSHYWIRHNKVLWASRWSDEDIKAARTHDAWVRDRYFDSKQDPAVRGANPATEETGKGKRKESLWSRLTKW